MEHLYKIYSMLDDELKEIARDGKIEKDSDIELIKCTTGGMKNIQTIIAMHEAQGTSRSGRDMRRQDWGGNTPSGGWGRPY